MPPIKNRSLLLLVALAMTSLNAVASRQADPSTFSAMVAALEHDDGGRIGVAAFNTTNGARLGYRADERFALCSTFKILLVSNVLSRVDAGDEALDRLVKYGPRDLESYAPITRAHLKNGSMTISELSAAAIEYSDNTAANLLLKSAGGPAALTRFVRTLGDLITRLDRNEPSLNTNFPGDPRDTTTPHAMIDTMRGLLVGNVLSPASRRRLIDWMVANTTGDAKLRAGLDPAWKVGDKTGSGENGASNDVAIVWPSNQPPYLVAVYYSGSSASQQQQSAVIATVGRLVRAAFYGTQ